MVVAIREREGETRAVITSTKAWGVALVAASVETGLLLKIVIEPAPLAETDIYHCIGGSHLAAYATEMA